MQSAAGSAILDEDRDVEGRSRSRSPNYVPNIGSAARDYCTIERTLLSFTRLGLVLFMLSASLLLKARIPDPDDGEDTGRTTGPASFPLGIIYSVAAVLAMIAGWMGYESDLKGLRKELGFVGGFKLSEVAVVVVALLLFATCVLLLRADYVVR